MAALPQHPDDPNSRKGGSRSIDWRRELDRLKTALVAARPARHEANGRRLPEVIAARLSKPLWYASVNAIDKIVPLDTHSSRTRSADSPRAQKRKGELSPKAAARRK